MKDNKLTIQINTPVSEVFAFTLDPKNTPKWIDSVSVEETSEWPVKVGTLYRNKGESSDWSEYTLADLQHNKTFTLTKKDDNFHVRYTFKWLDNNSTDFEYYEWVDRDRKS